MQYFNHTSGGSCAVLWRGFVAARGEFWLLARFWGRAADTAQRIRNYLAVAGHGEDMDVPLFRPVRGNRKGQETRRPLHPDVIDRTLRKYARHIGLERGYSAHSMRATFITTALDNGASLEEVQSAAGHADPSTTKLYDRRGYNPEKSASFFANY
jgi:integrase